MVTSILLYIWQLPQNLLGLLVILFSRARCYVNPSIYITHHKFGVSLGLYIILFQDSLGDEKTISHECGHQKQSLYLGWLYLFTIGILSASGNLFDRLFHKSWTYEQRIKWYYSLPWEKWADKLGGVNRFEKEQ